MTLTISLPLLLLRFLFQLLLAVAIIYFVKQGLGMSSKPFYLRVPAYMAAGAILLIGFDLRGVKP